MPIQACLVYEDTARSSQLLERICHVLQNLEWADILEVKPCDLGCRDNCVVALPCTDMHSEDAPHVLLSRFSGSSWFRDNGNLQDISLMLCSGSTGRTQVLNGVNVIQLEDSKPLQIGILGSIEFRNRLQADTKLRVHLPSTVLARRLSPEALRRSLAVLKRGLCDGQQNGDRSKLVIKPAFGGGSRGVHIFSLQDGSFPDNDLLHRFATECLADNSGHRPWLVQDYVGDSNLQIRIEIVDSRVCYAAVIRSTPSHHSEVDPKPRLPWKAAENLCMCEVGDAVQLTLCSTPEVLAAALAPDMEWEMASRLARGCFDYTLAISQHVTASVLATEFRVDVTSGHAYMIDLNLQSNYSYVTEESCCDINARFVTAPERYVEMLLREGLTRCSGDLREHIHTRMTASQLLGVPDSPANFEEGSRLLVGVTPVTAEQLVAKLTGVWSEKSRKWSHEQAQHVVAYTRGRADTLVLHTSPVTQLITWAALT